MPNNATLPTVAPSKGTRADETFPQTRPEDVFACLKYTGAPKTLEDMDAGILAEARERHARDRAGGSADD
jgi:hypothetical protein